MTDDDKALDKIIRASMPLDFERKETLSDDKALVERGHIECERCCGNGQTYGPNSGEDIICPDCEGTGRVD